MPWTIQKRDSQWCVYKKDAEDKPMGESLGCHASQEQAQAQMAALYANVSEFRGAFTDVLAITELRGSYPNVPIATDVDYAALILGDAQPVFITLPIGKAGVTSGNKRHYDDEFVTELVRQVLSGKPIGLMGHLSETDRATAFPAEAVHWVGAIRDGDTAWGKAYVVPGAVRDRIQRYKAQGKMIATSIDAFAEGIWDDKLGAHRMSAKSLRLNQIDIAPADRAGIPDLAAIPMLTTEMESEQATDTPQENNDMPDKGKLDYINEMTADDVRHLPAPVREALLATVPAPPEVAIVQELCTELGVDSNTLKTTIAEMRSAIEQTRKDAVKHRISELVNEGIKVESVRGLVTELVNARNPQTPEEAAQAVQQVLEMTSVQETLAATVQRVMGPRQTTPVKAQQGKNKYFQIPQEA